MAGGGFEPSKGEPPGLQSRPLYRPGTPPGARRAPPTREPRTGERSPRPPPRGARRGPPTRDPRRGWRSRRHPEVAPRSLWPQVLAGVAGALGLRERLELLQRVVLDRGDALARDVERAPAPPERPGAPAGQA